MISVFLPSCSFFRSDEHNQPEQVNSEYTLMKPVNGIQLKLMTCSNALYSVSLYVSIDWLYFRSANAAEWTNSTTEWRVCSTTKWTNSTASGIT